MEFGAKVYLEEYLPSMIKIINEDKDFSWRNIENFNKNIPNRHSDSNGSIYPTLFEMIFKAKNDDLQARGHLDFLNRLFEDMYIKLEKKEKTLVVKNIKDILKTLNYSFINFVGEIAALKNIMGTELYRLIKVEYPLPNSTKSIDFQFKEISADENLFVEVCNIHLVSEKVNSNPVELKKFISERVNQKIFSKGLNNVDLNFFIVPILWGSPNDLKIYSDYFQNNKVEINRVIEPLSYLTFVNKNGLWLHHFARISQLFDVVPNSSGNFNQNYKDGIY